MKGGEDQVNKKLFAPALLRRGAMRGEDVQGWGTSQPPDGGQPDALNAHVNRC